MIKVTQDNIVVGDLVAKIVDQGRGMVQHGLPVVVMSRTRNVIRYRHIVLDKDGNRNFGELTNLHPGVMESQNYHHLYAK